MKNKNPKTKAWIGSVGHGQMMSHATLRMLERQYWRGPVSYMDWEIDVFECQGVYGSLSCFVWVVYAKVEAGNQRQS
jgi:hypothetical protein